MSFVQFDGVGLSFGDRTILSEVQLTVSPGSRIALTGANGSGKSTLMKIAAGLQEIDTGRVILPKNTRVAYLPQSGIVLGSNTLLDEALLAFDELTLLKEESDRIAENLETGGGNQDVLLHRYQDILDTLERAGWDRREAFAEQVLTGLGFHRGELHREAGTFSGGWQMRIALARILLKSPDILLLDEPTNYLDIEAREWLRDFLRRFEGGVLLVSHDRSFLDDSCNQVAELLMTRLTVFQGTYSVYEQVREREMADLVERWKRQQEEIEKIETFIARFRYQATKARQVQSRIRMLEKIELIEIPPALKRIRFHFPEAPHSGRTSLQAVSLERRYGAATVFSGLDLELPRGSRTAVVGINGAGKTTLLRIISGEDRNYGGTVTWGSGVKVGYFSQDQESVLEPDLTVLEEAMKNADEGEGRMRSLLGAFLFSGDDIHKKVAVLSGGERNRLALLKILLEPVNLLVLDEPTNHLDIHSKDVLLDALRDYGGTLVIVSHDRYFLERIADRVLELDGGRGHMYLGDYAYYRWRREGGQATAGIMEPGGSNVTERIPSADAGSGLSHEEQKRRRALISRLRKEEESLTARLMEKEHRAAGLRAELERPENYSDPEKSHTLARELMETEERIEQITAAWEEAAEALQQAENGL